MLEIRDLNVEFSGKLAVRNTSFSVEAGESFGLVGESGSGKSTILRTVMGLNANWNGSISVDGLDVRKVPRKQLARMVQMVFQDPYSSLHPRYVIGQQIAEPMKINGIANPERRTAELLELIGLGAKFQFRFPHELSGGQRQRVAIARALALSPSSCCWTSRPRRWMCRSRRKSSTCSIACARSWASPSSSSATTWR
jgi:peptide/nickel transport system ATP-binding protein